MISITPYRSVQALQVAVDDKGEVVQFFPCRQAQAGNGLRFIHLSITEYTPYMTLLGFRQIAVGEVAHEACLVHGTDGANSHRAGGKLPEIRHQPWVGVGRQSFAKGFLAVVRQLTLAQATFEKSASINPGGRVWLEEHQ